MNNVDKKSNNFFSLENVFISSSILFALFCLLACFVKFCNAHSLYTVSLERYFLKLYPKRQDFSLFWKQIHVSSSSKFIITLLIRGNTLFYSSNNFNDQHVKCKPKICQRNLSNLSECSIALEMAADSSISLILRCSCKLHEVPEGAHGKVFIVICWLPTPPPYLTGWNCLSGKGFLEGHILRKGKYMTILVLFVQRKPPAVIFG